MEVKSEFMVKERRDKGGVAGPINEGKNFIVNSELRIDGHEDLSSTIVFNDGGCVYGIRLMGNPGFYDYTVEVDAKGPSGAFSGSGHLYFTDESGDTYALSIYSSTRSTHTVRYNSDKPNIVKIEWKY